LRKLRKKIITKCNGIKFRKAATKRKYLKLVSRARYAINPSKHEAFSMFTAEALAIGTPAIVSKEIAENLEAQARLLVKDLVIAEKAQIKTWSEMLNNILLTYNKLVL
jgi:glycosyltransferase involved in cell wall biosynthesis